MKIITNTAVSLDGKINTDEGRALSLGSDEDLRFMLELRDTADAVLVGGRTFRHWMGLALKRPKFLWRVVVSRTLDFQIPERVFSDDQGVHFLFISPSSPPAGFPAEVVTLNPVTPQSIIAELKRRGVQTLLIEAGGELIAQFLDADLIDEMHVTLCPKLIGGMDAPSIVGGKGFGRDELKRLKLLNHRVVGDEVFLHYAVTRPSRNEKESVFG